MFLFFNYWKIANGRNGINDSFDALDKHLLVQLLIDSIVQVLSHCSCRNSQFLQVEVKHMLGSIVDHGSPFQDPQVLELIYIPAALQMDDLVRSLEKTFELPARYVPQVPCLQFMRAHVVIIKDLLITKSDCSIRLSLIELLEFNLRES